MQGLFIYANMIVLYVPEQGTVMYCINILYYLSQTTYCLNSELFGLYIYLALNTKKNHGRAPSSEGGVELRFRLAPAAGYGLEFLGAKLVQKFTTKYFSNRVNDTLRSPQPQPGLEKSAGLGSLHSGGQKNTMTLSLMYDTVP